MSLRSILLTAIISGACWYWLKAREIKEYTLSRARRYCRDLDLVLLDETVVLDDFKMRRHGGSWAIYRRYNFDFTATGKDRYKGSIDIIGMQVLNIKLAPHTLPDTEGE